MGYTMHDTSDLQKTGRRLHITVSAIVVLAAAACLLAVPVMAHAPADMTISFDPNTAKIYVTVTHPVDDPATHYLKTVQVKLNERVISDPDYKSQPAGDTFTYTYDVTAHPGDTIRVIAICVRGGMLEKVYDVTRPVSPATQVQTQPSAIVPSTKQAQTAPDTIPLTVPPTAKAAAGLLPLLGAAAALMLRRL
jgi:hypothetical protein